MWLLVGIPTLAVILSTIGLVLAAGGAGDLVRDDYYKAGLAIQGDLSAESRAARLGYTARIAVVGDRVTLESASPIPDVLKLTVLHPAWRRLDRTIELRRTAGTRRWEGLTSGTLVGENWELVLGDAGGTWRLRGHAALPGRIELGAPLAGGS